MRTQDVVRRGYDRVSYAYRADQFVYEGSDYQRYLGWLLDRIKPGQRVLDLGCGNGVPISRALVGAGQRVVGADLSPVQIQRAGALVPDGQFIEADMTRLAFAPESFAAICCFFAIIHVPLAEQPPLLERMAVWLAPGGYLLLTAGSTAWSGEEEAWCGVTGATMVWSHADAATYRGWLAELGFVLLRDAFWPEGGGGHSVLLARSDP
ncbi:MAG: class I SAM-dependent methyltransferase [Candidatus Promineifilaceae bacterium]|nr:class I SAM-dependent methyltransferase [Candidatus Promineifilaceae bacterium]